MRSTRTYLLSAVLVLHAFPAAARVLVDMGSVATFRANLTDPGILGTDWTAPGFDTTGWTEGLFGIGYEQFVDAEDVKSARLLTSFVPVGTASVYARASFTIDDPAAVGSLFLALDYDDGVVAWINGVEVYRSPEMPAGDLTWNTVPLGHESSNGVNPDFSVTHDISAVALPLLDPGENLLAIGVWNEVPSTDMVVVPRLWANSPAAFVTRGPYLQQATPTGVTIRWSTDTNTKTRVWYGTAPGELNQSAAVNGNGKDHAVELTGLMPETTYYYAVGTNTEVLVGDDLEHRFRTAPLPGTRQPMRFWVVGDTGTPSAESAAVRDSFVELNGGTEIAAWLMLGDNAYESGTQDEYEGALFNRYPRLLRTATLWPTLGNHDAQSASSGSQTGVYYNIFTLPSAAEAGGLASGTEAYYSFDLGNVHFVVLDSEDSSRSPAGPMLTWLEADLMSTAQDWIVAYWHHPPYSKGSHNSDSLLEDFELVQMREAAVPILEDWGVDLVLAGHSHVYERSFLLDGHYGYSGSLTPEMILDDGDGRPDGDGAYQKASAGPASHEGTVYVVAGNGSDASDSVPGDHPVMLTSLEETGSVVLDVDGDRLELISLGDTGSILDRFTLVKNTSSLPTADFSGEPLVGPTPLAVDFLDLSSTNTAGWEWDLDGDGVVDDTLRHPLAVYEEPGLYEVRLTASNAAGSDQQIKVDYVCATAIPAVVTGVSFADPETLAWNAVAGATSYDVIQGDLLQLLSNGGFSGSVQGCVADGAAETETAAPTLPPIGGAHYYLVRAASCADEKGSYDSEGAGQGAPRDADLTPEPCS